MRNQAWLTKGLPKEHCTWHRAKEDETVHGLTIQASSAYEDAEDSRIRGTVRDPIGMLFWSSACYFLAA